MGGISPAEGHAQLRAGFASGVTRDLGFRLEQLRLLRGHLLASEQAMFDCNHADLRRDRVETMLSEIGAMHKEVSYFERELRRLARPRRVYSTPGETVTMERAPFGVVLVFGAYNFPLSLSLRPVIGAIAAGNCVLLKPSEIAAESAKYLDALRGVLDPRVFTVVTGGVDVATELLDLRWDYIMYTGGTSVGRIVMSAAAKHLTPVTLELGGKNPAFVCPTADLQVAATQVLWSRFVNAGQICLAADFCLVHESVLADFKAALLEGLKRFYKGDPRHCTAFGRMVSQKHFARVSSLLDTTNGSVVVGGERDESDLYIAPTILDVTLDDPLMDEEIFGPILSLVSVASMDDAIKYVKTREKPLALYIFSQDKHMVRHIKGSTASGSVGVNAAVFQIAKDGSHIGGVGESGMGAYGTAKSFETFTHERPCLHNSPWRSRLMEKVLQPGWTTEDGKNNDALEGMLRRYMGIPSSSSNRALLGVGPAVLGVSACVAVIAGYIFKQLS